VNPRTIEKCFRRGRQGRIDGALRRARAIIVQRVALPLMMLLRVAGCSHKEARPPVGAPDASDTSSHDFTELDRAEDMRRANDVPALLLSNDDPGLRRRAARAIARILDADDSGLLSALEDEDDETVAWAAFGLGESCRDQQDSHVRALSARLPSFDPSDRQARPIDALRSLLRALGRCATVAAERTLAAWLAQHRQSAPFAEEAAYALGDVAVARGSLVPETVDALLEASEDPAPLDAALYPFGRSDVGMGSRQKELLGRAARASLARPGPSRIFAVRALARLGTDALVDLSRIVTGDAFSPAERSEAARALARLDRPGIEALERAFASLVPLATDAVSPGVVGVLLTALQGIPAGESNPADSALRALASFPVAEGASVPWRRHASALRCGAAAKFATWDSESTRRCDLGDGTRGKLTRLEVLDRTPLRGASRDAWLTLTRSTEPVRVREAAVALLERHAEASDVAPMVLADALATPEPGLVAVAAEVLNAHPERAFFPATKERRAVPRSNASRPPVVPAKSELIPRVSAALQAALVRPWAEDLVDPRANLVDAAIAVGLDGARSFARSACESANPSLRARAARALETVGEPSASCRMPILRDSPAPEVGHCSSRTVRVQFETDAGLLGIRFDPTFAPVETNRLVALANSGFYAGLILHRASPGTIAQLGDLEGDGYGGAGRILRSEMSPLAFAPFDVGMALSGRDTGSSQFFVTLTRAPNLDGRYPWLGHAEGDWDSVVDGDLVQAAHVEP
jgi:cyclophilin family peptidyl-prolyl cis-trans isomerase